MKVSTEACCLLKTISLLALTVRYEIYYRIHNSQYRVITDVIAEFWRSLKHEYLVEGTETCRRMATITIAFPND